MWTTLSISVILAILSSCILAYIVTKAILRFTSDPVAPLEALNEQVDGLRKDVKASNDRVTVLWEEVEGLRAQVHVIRQKVFDPELATVEITDEDFVIGVEEEPRKVKIDWPANAEERAEKAALTLESAIVKALRTLTDQTAGVQWVAGMTGATPCEVRTAKWASSRLEGDAGEVALIQSKGRGVVSGAK